MALQWEGVADGLAALVVGNDMLIEALPARPIQLAHACRQAGFDLVLPMSWGDELVAEAAVGEMALRPAAPAVLCACPLVRQRLLASGLELAPALVSLVSPPVALSRQLRRAYGTRLRSLVFAGRCPSARAPDYDLTLDPGELLSLLASRGIELEAQPDVFVDTIPPDRRRFVSTPGGCPTADVLWHRCHERVRVDLEGNDLPDELAQLLLAPQPLLVDVAAVLGCSCSGVTTTTTGRDARIAVTSLEPPRAPSPVIEKAVGIELTVEIPSQIENVVRGDQSPARSSVGTSEVDARTTRQRRTPLAITPSSALRIHADLPDRGLADSRDGGA